jgi:hypothetical protein
MPQSCRESSFENLQASPLGTPVIGVFCGRVGRFAIGSQREGLQAVPYGTMSDNGIAGKDTLFAVARNPQSPVSFRFLQTENKHPRPIGSPSSSRRHAIFTLDGQRLVGSPKT